jgi:hypothetical protein
MKKCSKCHIEKDISCFGKDSKIKNGLKLYCKDCRKEECKIYRVKNSNKISDGIFIIDIGRCCQNAILENNKTTNKIYNSVSHKYSMENKFEIDKMISGFLPRLKPLPEYILNTSLF